jgi:hypothetical protein
MPYTPQTWVDNNASYPLSAARMNTIESGIQSAASVADQGHRILTTVQRDALTGVTTGTMIFNSTLGQTQIWTGSTWLQVGNVANTGGASDAIYNSPIKRFGYTTRTSTLACSGTSFATGTEIFASDITFTADGTSTYWVEFFLPGFNTDGTTHVTYFGLSDGSTTQIGLLTQYNLIAGFFGSTIQRFPYTPAAGSRSLNVRCWVSGSSSTIYAGVSGADFGPAYLAVYGGYLS